MFGYIARSQSDVGVGAVYIMISSLALLIDPNFPQLKHTSSFEQCFVVCRYLKHWSTERNSVNCTLCHPIYSLFFGFSSLRAVGAVSIICDSQMD